MTGTKDELELYITEEEISGRITELARLMNERYKGKKPVLLSVLSGSFVFTSDLIRNLDFDHTLTFTKIRSYKGTSSTNNFDFQLDLNEISDGQEIIVIEDIVDTGNTLNFLMNRLQSKNPQAVAVATLLLKPEVYRHPHKIDYTGFEIPDKFVVGYGMDLDHKYRNLRDIYIYNQNNSSC